MRILRIVVLCVLVFLAISSGITKILLMPQDVEFFGKYGFTSNLLIAFGAVQFAGGLLMIISKTRIIGAIMVAVTFAISAIVLFMEGSILPATVTLVALALLGLTMRWTLLSQRTK